MPAARAASSLGGLLVTQNGLPFLQAPELKQSVGYFRELFGDAFAYLATTPSYFGGPMSYGWATDNPKLRHHKRRKIERRYDEAGAFPTRYWTPEVHVAAFAAADLCQRAGRSLAAKAARASADRPRAAGNRRRTPRSRRLTRR